MPAVLITGAGPAISAGIHEGLRFLPVERRNLLTIATERSFLPLVASAKDGARATVLLAV